MRAGARIGVAAAAPEAFAASRPVIERLAALLEKHAAETTSGPRMRLL